MHAFVDLDFGTHIVCGVLCSTIVRVTPDGLDAGYRDYGAVTDRANSSGQSAS